MAAISSELPGALLKRMSPKAPPTATPAPIFPFTKVMTDATISGMRDVTRKKRLVDLMEKLMIHPYMMPAIRVTPAIVKN